VRTLTKQARGKRNLSSQQSKKSDSSLVSSDREDSRRERESLERVHTFSLKDSLIEREDQNDIHHQSI